jgi:hypothetical protein
VVGVFEDVEVEVVGSGVVGAARTPAAKMVRARTENCILTKMRAEFESNVDGLIAGCRAILRDPSG